MGTGDVIIAFRRPAGGALDHRLIIQRTEGPSDKVLRTTGQMTESKKILVVEDEPVVRSLCRAALSHYGFEPIMANDGLEGLELYRRHQSEIALILSDITMPRMSGLEMVDAMFALDQHTNVILMTGYDSHSEVPDRLQKICALLDKPFSVQELIIAVKKCLDSQKHKHPELSSK